MPSKHPLTKSYYDRRDPKYPTRDITLYQLWDEAKNKGYVGDLLNLETGERMTNLELLELVSSKLKEVASIFFLTDEGKHIIIELLI